MRLIFLSSMSSITRYRAYKSSLFFFLVGIRRLVLEPSVANLQKSKKNPPRILASNSNLNLNLKQEIIKKIGFPDISIDQIFEVIPPFDECPKDSNSKNEY